MMPEELREADWKHERESGIRVMETNSFTGLPEFPRVRPSNDCGMSPREMEERIRTGCARWLARIAEMGVEIVLIPIEGKEADKMTSRDFCYWAQGYFEINGKNEGLTADQVEIMRRHLSLVFKHEIDPSFPAEQQTALDAIHSGLPFQGKPGNLARC